VVVARFAREAEEGECKVAEEEEQAKAEEREDDEDGDDERGGEEEEEEEEITGNENGLETEEGEGRELREERTGREGGTERREREEDFGEGEGGCGEWRGGVWLLISRRWRAAVLRARTIFRIGVLQLCHTLLLLLVRLLSC